MKRRGMSFCRVMARTTERAGCSSHYAPGHICHMIAYSLKSELLKCLNPYGVYGTNEGSLVLIGTTSEVTIIEKRCTAGHTR